MGGAGMSHTPQANPFGLHGGMVQYPIDLEPKPFR
jgi:hypothetical protein